MQYNITYRKKDGGWQYIISFKEDGKWKQRSKQGFRTRGLAKVAADERLEELKKEYVADLTIEDKGITFREFTQKFLKDMERYREQNTIIAYEQCFQHFVDLEPIPMTEIKFSHVQDCVNEMIDKELKVSSINIYISRLKTFFNAAAKKPYNVIAENPINEGLIVPEKKEEEGKIKALTKAELNEILNILKPGKDYIICLIAATCGLRIGEILGLTWSDIDVVNKKITVNKQWKKLKDGSYGHGPVKRKNSNRIVPVPVNTINELLKYKNNYPIDISNRIIPDYSNSSVSNRIRRKLLKQGYNISVHDLRHTYGTMLIANGTDFKTAAQLLGHDVEQTMKTYSHVTDDMMNRVTDTINIIF